MKIPDYIKEIINNQELHTICTASKDGHPNIVYVKFLKVYDDDKVLVANNKFHKTEQNLKENPRMSFVVIEDKKAYQIKGSTETHTQGPVFDDTVSWVKEKRPDMYPKAGVLINVEEIYNGAEKIEESTKN